MINVYAVCVRLNENYKICVDTSCKIFFDKTSKRCLIKFLKVDANRSPDICFRLLGVDMTALQRPHNNLTYLPMVYKVNMIKVTFSFSFY